MLEIRPYPKIENEAESGSLLGDVFNGIKDYYNERGVGGIASDLTGGTVDSAVKTIGKPIGSLISKVTGAPKTETISIQHYTDKLLGARTISDKVLSNATTADIVNTALTVIPPLRVAGIAAKTVGARGASKAIQKVSESAFGLPTDIALGSSTTQGIELARGNVTPRDALKNILTETAVGAVAGKTLEVGLPVAGKVLKKGDIALEQGITDLRNKGFDKNITPESIDALSTNLSNQYEAKVVKNTLSDYGLKKPTEELVYKLSKETDAAKIKEILTEVKNNGLTVEQGKIGKSAEFFSRQFNATKNIEAQSLIAGDDVFSETQKLLRPYANDTELGAVLNVIQKDVNDNFKALAKEEGRGVKSLSQDINTFLKAEYEPVVRGRKIEEINKYFDLKREQVSMLNELRKNRSLSKVNKELLLANLKEQKLLFNKDDFIQSIDGDDGIKLINDELINELEKPSYYDSLQELVDQKTEKFLNANKDKISKMNEKMQTKFIDTNVKRIEKESERYLENKMKLDMKKIREEDSKRNKNIFNLLNVQLKKEKLLNKHVEITEKYNNALEGKDLEIDAFRDDRINKINESKIAGFTQKEAQTIRDTLGKKYSQNKNIIEIKKEFDNLRAIEKNLIENDPTLTPEQRDKALALNKDNTFIHLFESQNGTGGVSAGKTKTGLALDTGNVQQLKDVVSAFTEKIRDRNIQNNRNIAAINLRTLNTEAIKAGKEKGVGLFEGEFRFKSGDDADVAGANDILHNGDSQSFIEKGDKLVEDGAAIKVTENGNTTYLLVKDKQIMKDFKQLYDNSQPLAITETKIFQTYAKYTQYLKSIATGYLNPIWSALATQKEYYDISSRAFLNAKKYGNFDDVELLADYHVALAKNSKDMWGLFRKIKDGAKIDTLKVSPELKEYLASSYVSFDRVQDLGATSYADSLKLGRVGDMLENYSTVLDNIHRASFFEALRKQGFSLEKANIAVKRSTIDYQQEMSSYIKAFEVFIPYTRASIQGFSNYFSRYFDDRTRTQAINNTIYRITAGYNLELAQNNSKEGYYKYLTPMQDMKNLNIILGDSKNTEGGIRTFSSMQGGFTGFIEVYLGKLLARANTQDDFTVSDMFKGMFYSMNQLTPTQIARTTVDREITDKTIINTGNVVVDALITQLTGKNQLGQQIKKGEFDSLQPEYQKATNKTIGYGVSWALYKLGIDEKPQFFDYLLRNVLPLASNVNSIILYANAEGKEEAEQIGAKYIGASDAPYKYDSTFANELSFSKGDINPDDYNKIAIKAMRIIAESGNDEKIVEAYTKAVSENYAKQRYNDDVNILSVPDKDSLIAVREFVAAQDFEQQKQMLDLVGITLAHNYANARIHSLTAEQVAYVQKQVSDFEEVFGDVVDQNGDSLVAIYVEKSNDIYSQQVTNFATSIVDYAKTPQTEQKEKVLIQNISTLTKNNEELGIKIIEKLERKNIEDPSTIERVKAILDKVREKNAQ